MVVVIPFLIGDLSVMDVNADETLDVSSLSVLPMYCKEYCVSLGAVVDG